jgi:antitoxin HicB
MATKAKAKKPASKAAGKIKTQMKKMVPARKAAAAPKTNAKTARAPKDESFSSYSGKFTVRLPRSLHQALVDRAEKEGVSLNLFVTNALSRTVAVAGGRRK